MLHRAEEMVCPSAIRERSHNLMPRRCSSLSTICCRHLVKVIIQEGVFLGTDIMTILEAKSSAWLRSTDPSIYGVERFRSQTWFGIHVSSSNTVSNDIIQNRLSNYSSYRRLKRQGLPLTCQPLCGVEANYNQKTKLNIRWLGRYVRQAYEDYLVPAGLGSVHAELVVALC